MLLVHTDCQLLIFFLHYILSHSYSFSLFLTMLAHKSTQNVSCHHSCINTLSLSFLSVWTDCQLLLSLYYYCHIVSPRYLLSSLSNSSILTLCSRQMFCIITLSQSVGPCKLSLVSLPTATLSAVSHHILSVSSTIFVLSILFLTLLAHTDCQLATFLCINSFSIC